VSGGYVVDSVTLSDDLGKALVRFLAPGRTLWECTLTRDEFGRWRGTVPAPGVNASFEINILVQENRPANTAARRASLASDLSARLAATQQITSFMERDEVLEGIALDAARAGDADTARNAVRRITSFMSRDDAIGKAARLLVAAGKRAEALELAGEVTSFMTRDALITELAK
jgi:hypothetical protein